MDVGIRLPESVEKVHHDEAEEADRIEVIRDAHQELKDFKDFMNREYPQASSLYESAKNLYEEIKAHWTHGKHMVHKGEWTVAQFDQDMSDLARHQRTTWDKLVEAASEEERLTREAYRKVQDIEAKVIHERGEGTHVAWMGLPTKEQHIVRIVYSHQLRHNFADAKRETETMIGFPEGILTKIPMLRSRANQETAKLSQNLREHPRGSFFGAHLFHH